LRSYLNDESLSLAEHHREYFELGSDEAVAFNKDQRIVIVGQRVTQEIRQTASFLRSKGFRVTCVEFTFFQANGGTRLLSQEIVVGKESGKPRQVASGSLPIVTANEFLGSLDDNGKAVFSRILQLAKEKSMPIHWGTKGFSLNVDLGGRHVATTLPSPFTNNPFTPPCEDVAVWRVRPRCPRMSFHHFGAKQNQPVFSFRQGGN
jgi:hypothetical protein